MIERKLYESNEGFWVTPDVSVLHDSIINPGEIKRVQLIIDDRTRKLIRGVSNPKNIKTTIRSRYAHIGLNTVDHDLVQERTMDLVAKVRSDELVDEVDFMLQNHSQRKIALNAGDPILRFFNLDYELILKNRELIDAISNGKIKLTGDIGKDWDLAADDDGHISRILLRIKEGSRRWVAKNPANEPISIDPVISGFRNAIDELFEPVPQTEQHVFHILETESDLTLNSDIEGVLSPILLRSLEFPDMMEGFQTSSRLMDSLSDHQIRLEFVAPTSLEKRANAVSFQFLSNGRHVVA